MITVSKDISGRITVSFPYDPSLVEKVKTIAGRKWHKDKRYWSFPNTDGTLKKISDVFKGENIHLDPALQAKKYKHYDFEDLRRELVSRKYSYKTVKGYIYYNRDFLNFINKKPFEINDSDIKDYLLYLAEEKEAATFTLNQAINALKL